MGEVSEGPILDGAAISRSMAIAPGIRAVSLKNTGPSSIEGTVSVSNVGEFLSGGAESSFIIYTEGRAAGSSSLVFFLDRSSAPLLISRLSPEIEEYLTALMAPVVLGEESSRQEYLDLLAMVYGRPLADEISAARIRATIEFPRPLTALSGGTASGNRGEFDISLLDVLVLERPLRYEALW